MTDERLGWGILGPGTIARTFAAALAHSRTGRLVAIGARTARERYATDFPGARLHVGFDALLADPEVQAVYIATPHPIHATWAIRAVRAGKHVLVEKPLGMFAHEADAVFAAAREAGVFVGEAFMYRAHPMTARLIELVQAGTVGELRMIASSFGFDMGDGADPGHRLLAPELGGGGILDVGCYPVSMARLLAGAVHGQPFAEPVEVAGTARIGATGVDEVASAVLRFADGLLAEVSCAVGLKMENVLRITGREGRIEVSDFWFASGHEGGSIDIRIVTKDGERVEAVATDGWLYAFEADAVADAIAAGSLEFASPAMSHADTLGNLRVLDRWRAGAGLVYPSELPQPRKTAQVRPTLSGEPLRKGGSRIGRISVKGLGKPASRLALGFEDFRAAAHVAPLLDAFFEAGGNVYDTAFVYGGGKTEAIFGDWLRDRGVRDEVVIIGKGAHSPLCYPDVIGKQLEVTLDRLGTDHVDVYFMHRDNPEVPVGEFVDAMAAEVAAGRIRGPFGGSNWSMERFDAAIAHAGANGRPAPSVLSNNFSLARMIKPIWAGCVAASDPAWRAWMKDRGITNFAWSSQGRGFFTEAAGREKTGNAELVETWYSEANFGRRDRAIALAAKRGCSPIHVALAYCLTQEFAQVPLIGPRWLSELSDSLRALDVALTADEVAWLDGD